MPLRAKRRRTRAMIAFIILLLIGALMYAVHWASYAPQFSINSIFVTGVQQVSGQVVRQYVETILDDGSYHFLSRKNTFVYPRGTIEKAVVGFFPRIKSAKVSHASLLATSITVTVVERQPFALWCEGANDPDASVGTPTLRRGCYLMDDEGFIFAPLEVRSHSGLPAGAGPLTGFAPKAASSTNMQYLFSGGLASSTSPIGQTFVRAHLPGLVALLQLLGQAGFEPGGASVDSAQDFSVSLARGFAVKASFGKDVSALAKDLQLVLSSDSLRGKEAELEYIDLRFGNRVYYKLKGEAETATQ